MPIRLRFAPSPTGALHIGGVRTALYNYLLAKKNNGTYILRIEDTDQERFVPGAEEYIIESLKWCGIEPTEGIRYGGPHPPYRQSERKDLYHQYVQDLVDQGKAYYAFDTPEELEAMRTRLSGEGVPAPKYDASVRMSMRNSLTLNDTEVSELFDNNTPCVVRLRVDPDQTVGFEDSIRGLVSFNTSELDDKVLLKSDGMPTYHMANVIDDHLMEITHVIRGEEWLSSTGHHLLLYEAFGWDHPQFAHLPLIMRPDGKGKLSKRDGAKFGIPVFPLDWKGANDEDSFLGFKGFGFEPEAVINFLAFLGWNPGTEQEIFSLNELVDAFDIQKVHKAGARFDFEKALWYNQQYIRRMPLEVLMSKIRSIYSEHGIQVQDDQLKSIATIYQERLRLIKDIFQDTKFVFEDSSSMDSDALKKLWKPALKEKLLHVIVALKSQALQDAVELETITKSILQENELKPGEVFPLFRLGLCGSLQGPTVFQMLQIMGKPGLEKIEKFILNQ